MRPEILAKILLVAVSITLFLNKSEGQWVESNNGINGGHITALIKGSGDLFAGTLGGVYYSSNNGSSWASFKNNLDNTSVNGFVITKSNKLFVALDGGGRVFVSPLPAKNWSPFSTGLPANSKIISLAAIENQVFGLTDQGFLFTSNDHEASWSMVNTGLTRIESFTAITNHLFVGTNEGVFQSVDNGAHWLPAGLLNSPVYAITSTENFLLATTRTSGVYLSKDNGASWFRSTLETSIYKMVMLNGTLLASNLMRAYFSTDQGTTWDQVRTLPGATDFAISNSTLFAGTRFGIYKSTDGQFWTINNTNSLTNSFVVGFASSANKIFCGTGLGVYRSEDLGTSWASVTKGLSLDAVTAINYIGTRLFVALTNYGIYFSDNDGDFWTLAFGLPGVTFIGEQNGNILIGGFYGIYASSNNGITWSKLPNAPTHIKGLVVRGDTLHVCSSSGISFSSNRGESWSQNNDGLPLSQVIPISIVSHRESLFVGTENNGAIYKQKKINSLWQLTSNGITTGSSTTSFSSDEQNFFSGGGSGVYLSNNAPVSWSPFFKNDLPVINELNRVESLSIHRNHLFAGTTANGVWVSCIEPPRPAITAIGNNTNDSTLVSSSAIGNQWFFNGIAIPGAIDSSFKPTQSGNYTVKVNWDGCESKLSTVRPFALEVYDDPVITMPNVFTPEGDKFNPLFIPMQYENISSAMVQVINRWGTQVFRSNNVLSGWDGKDEPPGIYYYQIQFKGMNGSEGKVKGWVHLIR